MYAFVSGLFSLNNFFEDPPLVYLCVSVTSFLLSSSISVYYHTNHDLFILSAADRHLNCLQLLAVLLKAAKNIYIEIFV